MSSVFGMMSERGHEQLVFSSDAGSGLRCIIAIHDSTLGVPVGGTRVFDYQSEGDAIADALKLSEGMTQKAAVSGCSSGGAKAVIWADPADKTEYMLRAFGRFVESMNGRFVTGTDVGTTYHDFVIVGQETDHVVAKPEIYGGSGDTALITAYGVWHGIKACAQELWGDPSLAGRTVCIQGVGKVGARLAQHLRDDGASLVLADVDSERLTAVAKDVSAETVAPDEVYDVECDILSPNALGGVLSADTIPRLKCSAVAGGANNQLAAELEDARRLKQRGILYAPDYVINAGGLLQAYDELHGYIKERAFSRAAGLKELLLQIFAIAREEQLTTFEAAEELVRRRIDTIGRLGRIYLPKDG